MKRGFQFAAASKLAGAAGQRIGREESDAPSSEPTESEPEQSGLPVGEDFSNVFLKLSAARQDFANRMVEIFQRFALDSAFDNLKSFEFS